MIAQSKQSFQQRERCWCVILLDVISWGTESNKSIFKQWKPECYHSVSKYMSCRNVWLLKSLTLLIHAHIMSVDISACSCFWLETRMVGWCTGGSCVFKPSHRWVDHDSIGDLVRLSRQFEWTSEDQTQFSCSPTKSQTRQSYQHGRQQTMDLNRRGWARLVYKFDIRFLLEWCTASEYVVCIFAKYITFPINLEFKP